MTAFLYEVLDATWWMTLEASPYILFGLLMAGLMHVLLPESLVLRWMGRPGLSGVVRAAFIGVPLPVCSCGVVPITVELRRKGASQPASQSFLITTPESSIDSIFLTWGLMGPVMAIARPIAAFFTAILGGVLSIASAKSLDELTGSTWSGRDQAAHDHDHDHDHTHDHDHPHDHHHHDHHHHDHHHDHDLAYARSAEARQVLRDVFVAKGDDRKDLGQRFWKDLARPALRYGFSELLDDLAFWLVVGLGVAGLLTAALPDNLGELGLGSGLMPMIVMLIIGTPMYMCASASTPIAAALLVKGVSPGAALVFMLAGPATNAATVLLLAGTFGRRFVKIYLVSVVAGALAAGLLLDALLGGSLPGVQGAFDPTATPGWLSVALSLVLGTLLVLSLVGGAWKAGVAELRSAQGRLMRNLPVFGRVSKRAWFGALAGVALLAYLATGLRVVPPEYRGYGFLFGELVQSDLEPGLHYLPPEPFGWWQIRRSDYPRKSDVGFSTDLEMLAQRRALSGMAPRDEWHSPVAAMNPKPEQATFLTADENLVEMSFSVHYSLSDAKTFFYGVDHREDFVNLYAESVARELVATAVLDDLLTERRPEIEERLAADLQRELDAASVGVRVRGVQIVDLHPPGDAVQAFRDVSSAKEDRETAIHKARGRVALSVPRARGNAVAVVAEAEAAASQSRQEAVGRTSSFLAIEGPYSEHPEILGHLLWLETSERVLAGRQKYIFPSDSPSHGVTLWRDRLPRYPIFTQEDP